MREKPRYRIKWDHWINFSDEKVIVGYWVFTCNKEAIDLHPSFYMNSIQLTSR